ncbi:MAG: TetR/AcrR family transcriptional regulator [Bacteroidales bacterium]|nr:TetR/AcrR family transcriptional regulator [Bacteroidales bacterium]
MQILKDNIRKKILDGATKEFLEKGFSDASMRTIASMAGISVSTIYTYYQNKDELMTEVCMPFVNAANTITITHHSADTNLDDMLDPKAQRESARMMIALVKKYRDIIRLILFRSEGSSMNNFRDEYTDRTTAHILWFFGKMKMKYPQINTEISNFFLHASCAWTISIIGEIVSHDLSEEEIEKFIKDYVQFSTAGWAKLFGVEPKEEV